MVNIGSNNGLMPDGTKPLSEAMLTNRRGERERLRLSAFLRTDDIGGPYRPYKPFNHNLYIGIIIFPHIDNPQSTGYN